MKLKTKFRGFEKKNLLSNTLHMGALQALNLLLPLISIPYIIRVIGPEMFGLISFATATISYFLILTDYGFNLSAVRQISINRHNQKAINQIYSSVMTVKALLFLLCCLLMILILCFDKFNAHWEIYLITFILVPGQILFPNWLFQGMEKMQHITYLNILIKVFFTVCIFIFVNNHSDFLLVPLFTSLGYLFSGICSLILVKKQFDIEFSFQSFKKIKYQLHEGWHVFFSSISISLYTTSTVFILGLFAGNAAVGYYSIADKIIQATKGVFLPFTQALYPFISSKFYHSKNDGFSFLKTFTLFIGILIFMTCLFIFYYAAFIVHLISGEFYPDSIFFVRVMSFLPLVVFFSNILGIQVMLNFGLKRAFSIILALAALLGIVLNLSLVPFYGGLGSSVSILLVEVFVTFMMAIYVRNKFRKGIF